MSLQRTLYVPIVGGLGNQMFLLATGIAAVSKNKPHLKLAVPRFDQSDSCFEPRPVYWSTVFQNIPTTPLSDSTLVQDLPNAHIISESLTNPEALEIERFPPPGECAVLRGFFQSPHYFDAYRTEVCQAFLPPALVANAEAYLMRLLGKESKDSEWIPSDHQGSSSLQSTEEAYTTMLQSALSVDVLQSLKIDKHVIGLHVRRGDYLKLPDMFHVLTIEYYLEALQTLYGGLLYSAARHDLAMVIFSEDKLFAKMLAGTLRSRFRVADSSVIISDSCDYLELYAMTRCNDLIIANSSFSWWGAYLQQVPHGRVVAPSKWFKERGFTPSLYPNAWILI